MEVLRNAGEVSVGDEVEVKLANSEIICEVRQTSVGNISQGDE
jgi:hypothetical protein